MIAEAERLLQRHRQSGVLLDTNLLFVYVLGAVDAKLVGTAKKAREFAGTDFDLLVSILDRIRLVIVTAYVATEVSNLATSLSHYHRERFLALFRAFLANQSVERHIPLRLVVELEDFDAFGATDTAILRTRTRPPLVITADADLAIKLESMRRPVINFNHIRGESLGVYTPTI